MFPLSRLHRALAGSIRLRASRRAGAAVRPAHNPPCHTWEKKERKAKRALFLLETAGCPASRGRNATPYPTARPMRWGRDPAGIKSALRGLGSGREHLMGEPVSPSRAPLFLTRNQPPRRRNVVGGFNPEMSTV